MWSRKFASVLCMLGLTSISSVALAQSFHVIPMVPGDSYLYDGRINADGSTFAGSSAGNGPVHAFYWTAATGTVPLSLPVSTFSSGAQAANADGSVIVGWNGTDGTPGYYSGALKWSGGTPSLLSFSTPSQPTQQAYAVNADGTIVAGYTRNSNGRLTPCRWTPNGMDIAPMTNFFMNIYPMSISADGNTIAYTTGETGGPRAWVWYPGNDPVELPRLPNNIFTAQVFDMSSDGQTLVGFCAEGNQYFAVRWTSQGIEKIDPSGSFQFAYGCNADASIIVGPSQIWTSTGGLQSPYNYFYDRSVDIPFGISINHIRGISKDGNTFCGDGTDFVHNTQITWVLTVGPKRPNAPPIANAGADQTVEATGQLTQVLLDGSASYDPDNGDGISSYHWTEGATDLGSGSYIYVDLPLGHHVINLDVTDNNGHTTSDTVVVDVVDTTPPNVYLNGDQDVYLSSGDTFNDPGATAYDVVDGYLPVAVTGVLNTNVPGTYVLTYTATDSSGHSASAYRTIHVTYSWSGFLQPINADGSSIFKLGSTVPVKFTLTGASSGLSIVARLYVAKVSDSVVGTELEAISTAAGDTGNQFRYTGGQYVFNLNTKSLSAGTWQIRADLGDGVFHGVYISLK